MESGDAHVAETASHKLVVQWSWDVHGPPFGTGVQVRVPEIIKARAR